MTRGIFIANLMVGLILLLTLVIYAPFVVSALFTYQGQLDLERAVERVEPSRSVTSLGATARRIASSGDSQTATLLVGAAAKFERALQWQPHNSQARRLLIETALLRGDGATARRWIEGLNSQEVPRRDYAVLGALLAQAGDLTGAASIWGQLGVSFAPLAPTAQVGAGPIWVPLSAFSRGQTGVQQADIANRRAVMFFTNDTIEAPIRAPVDGVYVAKVTAQNSKPAPVELELQVDGDPAARFTFTLGDNSWSEQANRVTLTPGWHLLGIRFTNDLSTATEDRNALVAAVELAPVQN